MEHIHFLQKAIALADVNAEQGGGPFGAVIVRDGRIIAEGANQVTCSNDPTAHAEVQAIRSAGQKLGTFNLSGCTLYSSCEPCPMCFSAIYWAHIDKVFYAANKNDAEEAGFDDAFIYKEIGKSHNERSIPFEEISIPDAKRPFERWNKHPDKIKY
jgi:tRNA(Arg) A34 adenosine deaminase TadA